MPGDRRSQRQRDLDRFLILTERVFEACEAVRHGRRHATARSRSSDLLCQGDLVRIFHIATSSDWAATQESGSYTTSTIGVSLEQEGFLHASRVDQWQAVRERYYADVSEPLVLLEIETDLLDVPWVEELPAPEATETFPHIYGPLQPDAVVAVTPLLRT